MFWKRLCYRDNTFWKCNNEIILKQFLVKGNVQKFVIQEQRDTEWNWKAANLKLIKENTYLHDTKLTCSFHCHNISLKQELDW